MRKPAGNTWNGVEVTYNIYMLAVPRSTRIGNKDSVKWSCLDSSTHTESHRAADTSERSTSEVTVALHTFLPKRANLNLTGMLFALPAKHASLTCLKRAFKTKHALDCRPASVVPKMYPRQNLCRYGILTLPCESVRLKPTSCTAVICR